MPKVTVAQGLFRLLIVFTSVLLSNSASGQCDIPVRSYAITQQVNVAGLGAGVDNPERAANGNMMNYSTLKSGVAGSAVQFLDLGSLQTAGTSVTVKLSFPSGLLSLLGGVKVQPYTNLHNSFGWTADPAGRSFSGTTLLNLLNGAGDVEITIVPQTSGGTSVQYSGVWIELSGIAVGQSIDVYGAFVEQAGTTAVPCNTAIDVLSGIRTTVVGGLATATGNVISPWAAVDNDNGLSTYAEMQVGVDLLSQVFHTTIFNSKSQLGDKVRLVLQRPGGGLLGLNLITNFTIQLYNGNTPAGTPVGASSGLLSLSLLPGSTAGNEKYELILAPPAAYGVFDRVEVQVGGLANVGLVPGLRIYDVKRLIANPATNIDGAPGTLITVCEGNTATLAVNNLQSCTTYKWYDAANAGTLLHTGTSYTPSAASLSTTTDNIFYVEVVRDGCTETTERTAVTIKVNPRPTIAPGTAIPVCTGVTTTTVPYTATNAPDTYSITWNSAAATSGFANVINASLPPGNITITIPTGVAATTYTGNITVKNANGCVSTDTPISVKVDARPGQPTIALTN